MSITAKTTAIAYCGVAPLPAGIALAWNLDPPLIAALGLFGLLVAYRARHATAGWSALALMLLIFVSPLCALTSALFSARVIHHVILIAMVAPLLVLAFRLPGNAAWLDRISGGFVFAAHMVLLWLWHAPAAYAWALATVWGYWLMQVTLLGSAWLLWRQILAPDAGPARSFGLLLGTVAQMGLLGALLVFAPEPLYAFHFFTTEPWGLTPLEDQQLAGLLMWVPAVLPYLIVALRLSWRLLPGDERAVS